MATFRRVDASAMVTIFGVSLGESSLLEIACLNCGGEMTIHQPDDEFPDRMLGTCSHCREWFLWDFDPGTDKAVVVLLPNREVLKRTAGGAGA